MILHVLKRARKPFFEHAPVTWKVFRISAIMYRTLEYRVPVPNYQFVWWRLYGRAPSKKYAWTKMFGRARQPSVVPQRLQEHGLVRVELG
jgi:hypothetical protein